MALNLTVHYGSRELKTESSLKFGSGSGSSKSWIRSVTDRIRSYVVESVSDFFLNDRIRSIRDRIRIRSGLTPDPDQVRLRPDPDQIRLRPDPRLCGQVRSRERCEGSNGNNKPTLMYLFAHSTQTMI